MMHTHIYICDLMTIHLQNIHTRMYKTHDAVATGVSAARLLLFFTVQCSESFRLRRQRLKGNFTPTCGGLHARPADIRKECSGKQKEKKKRKSIASLACSQSCTCCIKSLCSWHIRGEPLVEQNTELTVQSVELPAFYSHFTSHPVWTQLNTVRGSFPVPILS